MSTYMTMWSMGGVVGMAGAVWVLHRRGALNRVTVSGLVMVLLAFLYGSKVQHGLVYKPVLDAFLLSPAELLGPGRRLPLGLMMSLSVGLLWCGVFRANWKAMGDALALLAPLMQGIGRIGCFVSGCCTGTVCHLPWAVTYGRNSDAHMLHVAMEWIPKDAALSLPVHPLPLYYSLFYAAMAGVMIWMLLRKKPVGSLLLVGIMIGPPARFALEQLRGGLPWRDWDRYLVSVEIWIGVSLLIGAVLVYRRTARYWLRDPRFRGRTSEAQGAS